MANSAVHLKDRLALANITLKAEDCVNIGIGRLDVAHDTEAKANGSQNSDETQDGSSEQRA